MIWSGSSEQGAGLIEVMIALVITMISALMFSNILTSAHMATRESDIEYQVNERARDMLELLKANTSDAKSGLYNSDFETLPVIDSGSSVTSVNVGLWKSAILADFSNGGGKIECSDIKCTVSVRWSDTNNRSAADRLFELTGFL